MLVAAGRDELRDDTLCERGRDPEADVVAAAGVDNRDDITVEIDQRAAAVAGVDRRVGLDRIRDLEARRRGDRAIDAADDAACHRPIEVVGVADSQHLPTDLGVVVGERQRCRGVGDGIDREGRKVAVLIDADHISTSPFAVVESHACAVSRPDDVGVCDDVVCVVHEPGSLAVGLDENDRIDRLLVDLGVVFRVGVSIGVTGLRFVLGWRRR